MNTLIAPIGLSTLLATVLPAQTDRPRTLLEAVNAGDRSRVAAMLAEGADPNDTSGGFGQLPIEVAMRRDDLATARLLIDHIDDIDAALQGLRRRPLLFHTAANPKFAALVLAAGADINVRDELGNTPLHRAILDRGAAAYLLSKGAAIHATNKRGEQPLHVAVREGTPAVVRFAIDRGADPLVRCGDGQSTLHLAASTGRADVLPLLLAHKVPVDARDKTGFTPLHYAIQRQHEKVARALIDAGARTTPWNGPGPAHNPMGLAAATGNVAIAQLLLARGARLGPKAGEPVPLPAAVRHGHSAFVRWLIDRGTDLARQTQGLPLLCHAGNAEVAKLLLEHDCDPNERGASGQRPLHSQAHMGRSRILSLLLTAGADLTVRNGQNATPLLSAATNGKREAIALLLARGADPTAVDHRQRTALHRMAWLDAPGVARLLIDAKCPVGARDAAGDTALHRAAQHGNLGLARTLLAAGADPRARNAAGQTPAELAAQAGHAEVARLLR